MIFSFGSLVGKKIFYLVEVNLFKITVRVDVWWNRDFYKWLFNERYGLKFENFSIFWDNIMLSHTKSLDTKDDIY